MRLRSARRDPALISRALGLIAATAWCFALGAYTGPHLATGIALIAYLAVFGCLLSLPFAARRSAGFSTVLTLAFGAATGLALAPTVVYYTAADPRVMWQTGGMAGLFTVACGVAGWLARPGLPWLARILLTEALAMALCGIVLVSEYMALVAIGYAAIAVAAYLSCAVLGISLLRRTRDFTSAPLLVASVFAAPGAAFFFVVRNSFGLAFDAAFRRQVGLAVGPARPR
jgi:modulator of FtsH protease